MVQKVSSSFYMYLGYLFVALGFIGVFLPIMPTTPFLIVAAFCFSKGKPELHKWLRDHKIFGPPLRDWEDHRRIKFSTKITVTVLILGSAVSAAFVSDLPEILRFMMWGVMFCVVVFIWLQK